MAEGLFKKMTAGRKEKYTVSSAGVFAVDGYSSTEETIRAMAQAGVDVSGHRSRRLKTELIRASDKVFVMARMHKDWILGFAPEAEKKVFLLTEFHRPAHGDAREVDIPDPIQMSDSFYQNVLSVIRECVKEIVASL